MLARMFWVIVMVAFIAAVIGLIELGEQTCPLGKERNNGN